MTEMRDITAPAGRIRRALIGWVVFLPEYNALPVDIRAAMLRRARRGGCWRGALDSVALIAMFMVLALDDLVAPWLRWGLGVPWAVFALWLAGRGTRSLRRRIGAMMDHARTHGHFEFCVFCDYDLRAATGATCPECGNPISLPIISAAAVDRQQRVQLWVAGILWALFLVMSAVAVWAAWSPVGTE